MIWVRASVLLAATLLDSTAVWSLVPSRNPVLRSRQKKFFLIGRERYHSISAGQGTLEEEENQKKVPRRRRKNKYEKFSRVEPDTDAFDELLAETNKKLRAIEDEAQRRKEAAKPRALNLPPPPKLSFPDTKGIDPYDPTTFGYTEIGFVTGAHGVNGWLKVKSTTDFPVERLCTAGIRHLKPERKRAPRQVILVQGKRRLEDEYLIQLEDLTDRDEALKYRGSTLYVRQEEKVVPPQKERKLEDELEEYYMVSDLVGLEVRMANEAQSFVGLVNSLVLAEDMCSIPGLGHDTLEVVLQQGPMPSFRDELVLIPLVRQIVPKVDIANGYLLIDPPGGLLDLTYVRSERVRVKGILPYNVDEETPQGENL